MAINTLIFDLGGVMIDWNPRRLYEKLFRSDHAIDFFLNRVTTSEWNEMQDGGRSIADANDYLINKFPEYTHEILAFYDRWETEMLGGVIPGMQDVLKYFVDSAEYHKVVALTNWSAETFPIAVEKFEFLNWFDGILVSGVEKLKKPDPRIYNLLLDRYQLDPESSLFIDDNLRNVQAAENLGIKAIHFTGVEQLIQKLDDFAIRID